VEDEDLTRLLLALAVFCLLAAGCGEKEESLAPGERQKLELMLDFFPNADHAPIYAADAGGHFEDVGLDVEIRQPPDPAAPLKHVAAGRVDLAISYEPEVLRARDKGLAVVAVGALVQAPLTSIISLPGARIRTPEDLDGKVVGTAGIDYQSAYLSAISKQAGAKVEQRDVGFNLSAALLSKKVDAVLGAFWNYEGTDLRLRKRDPRIIRLEQAGVPTYDELVFVANADREDERIKRFVAALERGTEDLRRDPGAGVKGLLDANRDLDPELQRAVVDVTLPLFQPPRGKPYGWQDPNEWNAFAKWMRDNELLEDAIDARGAFTNGYLPGAGP
jgi:putative hydroxymethylpyrimidine transport system substrate-binding protein